MQDNTKIRTYSLGDYPWVVRILEEGDLFYKPMDSPERLEQKISRDPRSIFVAVRSDEVVGTVSIMEDGRTAFIFRLGVSKEYRNKGIGKLLMSTAEEELFSRGYKEIHVLVEEENSELQDYYHKQGYEKGNIYRWMTKERK